MQLGLIVADTFESSSMLIYTHSEQSICTWWERHDAVLIKPVIKLGSQLNEISRVNEK